MSVCNITDLKFILLTFCRENFRHKLLLIQAERARIGMTLGTFRIIEENEEKKDWEDALELYERAIAAARHAGFANYEALGTI